MCKERIVAYTNALKLKNEAGAIHERFYDIEYGRRFAKVIGYWGGRSVHTFIEIHNGNIWKAGTWHQPQKNGVRGNIWQDDLGMSVVSEYGAIYLK